MIHRQATWHYVLARTTNRKACILTLWIDIDYRYNIVLKRREDGSEIQTRKRLTGPVAACTDTHRHTPTTAAAKVREPKMMLTIVMCFSKNESPNVGSQFSNILHQRCSSNPSVVANYWVSASPNDMRQTVVLKKNRVHLNSIHREPLWEIYWIKYQFYTRRVHGHAVGNLPMQAQEIRKWKMFSQV